MEASRGTTDTTEASDSRSERLILPNHKPSPSAAKIAEAGTPLKGVKETDSARPGKDTRWAVPIQIHPAFINKLSPEVLGQVFVHTLGKAPVDLGKRGLMGVPWTLLLVCSHWRHVALTEPHLWNNLSVVYYRELPRSLISFWHKILARCHTLPLSLTVTLPFINGIDFMGLVTPYLRRVSNLSLCSPDEYFPTLQGHTLCILESITLVIGSEAMTMLRPLQSSILTRAPKLRQVEIINYRRWDLSIRTFNLPWAQLTDLKIHSHSTPYLELLDILRGCSKLKSLDLFQTDDGFLREDYGISQIRLNMLESLLFYDCHVKRFCTILDHLTLPSLKRLSFPGPVAAGHISSATSLLERSQCILDALGIAPANGGFDRVVKLLPELSELKLLSSCVSVHNVLPILRGEVSTIKYLTCSAMEYNKLFEFLEDASEETEVYWPTWKGPNHMDFWNGPADDERVLRLEERFAKLGVKLHISTGLDIPCNRG